MIKVAGGFLMGCVVGGSAALLVPFIPKRFMRNFVKSSFIKWVVEEKQYAAEALWE